MRWILCIALALGAAGARAADEAEVLVPEGEPEELLEQVDWVSQGSVNSVAFSPDGRTMASAESAGIIKIWDVWSGKELRRLQGHTDWVRSVAYAPDGRTLASGGDDGEVVVWEVGSGRELRRLKGHTRGVMSVAYAPDGRTLASGGDDREVVVWEVGSGRELRRLQGHRDGVSSVAYAPDGRMLASAGHDREVVVWEVESGRELGRLKGHRGRVLSVAYAPDGRTLASGGNEGEVVVWEVGSGRELKRLQGHTGWVRSVAYAPDGRRLASGGDEGEVVVWEVESGRELRRLKGHTGRVLSVAYASDGRTLASGGAEGEVVVWEVGSGRELRRLKGHTGWVLSVAYAPDGRTLASGGDDGTLRLWSRDTGHPIGLNLLAGEQGWLSFRRGMKLLRSDDGRLLYRHREDGVLEPILPPQPDTAPRLSATVIRGKLPGDLGEVGEIILRVSNGKEGGRAYWVSAEAVKLSPGLILFPPRTLVRLEPGQTQDLRLEFSYLRPDGAERLKDAQVAIKLTHAYGEGLVLEETLSIQSPDIQVKDHQVEGDSLRIILENKGDQATGVLTLTSLFDGKAMDGQVGTEQRLSDLPPGQTAAISVAVPPELIQAGTFAFALTARYERWPRTWTQTLPVQVPSPFMTYMAMVGAAFLLGASVYYARVYRNPIVLQTAASPDALRRYPLQQMRAVDQALQRAKRRHTTLTAAGIPSLRWERTLRAAESPQRAAETFVEAVGAKLGDSMGSDSWALALPPLRLRFARDTALLVVGGGRLESGEALRRVEDVFKDGKGPGQVLVLDRTEVQNAAQVLHRVPRVRCVVLSSDRLRDLLLADEPVRILEATMSEQVAVRELSPYQVAGGVKDEVMFFGRERELRSIVDRSLRNFLVVGQRQMGKSTLLFAVQRRLQARGDVDVHYVQLTDERLHQRLVRERGLLPSGAAELPPFLEVAAGERSRPRVWLIDEADEFISKDVEAGYPLVRAMRALAEEGRAYFILAGFWELYRAVVLDERQPLRNFGEHLRLEPLDERAAQALVTDPMTALGLQWDSPETVAHLLEQAGRRANLLVLACKGLIETLPADTRSLPREHLERVLREDRDLRDQCRRWRGDSPLHRAVVRQALLLGQPTREEVRQALSARGAQVPAADFDQALDHRELSYVLVPEAQGRLSCPVPLMRYYIEAERGLEAGLAEDLRDMAEA